MVVSTKDGAGKDSNTARIDFFSTGSDAIGRDSAFGSRRNGPYFGQCGRCGGRSARRRCCVASDERGQNDVRGQIKWTRARPPWLSILARAGWPNPWYEPARLGGVVGPAPAGLRVLLL
jgi:hypothetical protein